MANDEGGEWRDLVTVVHRGESDNERWMLDRIASGQYPMRWLDERGARRTGKLPEELWRAGYVDPLFGLLSYNGHTYQRIQVLLPREQCEPEPIERWRRDKPSQDDVSAAVRDLERVYSLDVRPAEKEIVEKVRALHPHVTRKQVRDALEGSPLKGVSGYKSNV